LIKLCFVIQMTIFGLVSSRYILYIDTLALS